MVREKHGKILDYSRIDKNVFIGTNLCCKTHFEEKLLKAGVTADISLEEKHIDHPFGVEEYLWIPTRDHKPPSVKKTLIGIAALDTMLKMGQRVYIHCKNGHGRSPTFYAAYLVLKRGMSVDDAVISIVKKRPRTHIEDVQRKFLDELAKKRDRAAFADLLGQMLP